MGTACASPVRGADQAAVTVEAGGEAEASGPVVGAVQEPAAAGGLTVSEFARRYRVGEDKVRKWIYSGELPAVNTAAVLCGRPRFVITPDGLAAFERRRAAATGPSGGRRRKARRRMNVVDYYPGDG
jgi:hypothetical protein